MKTLEEMNALKAEEMAQVSSGIGDKDEGRIDTRLRCTKCGARMWASEVPDYKVCPACGARGTLITDI